MKKPTIVYLDAHTCPVDLESLTDCAGKIEFDSLMAAYLFINNDIIYKKVGDDFEDTFLSYDMVQKYLKRYGYFKAYTYVNGYFLSFIIKYV